MKDGEKTERQLAYQQFLQSDYWRDVSIAVKARAGNRCQVCNGTKQLEAHHRTYEHHGNEMNHLADLVCLCRKCHSTFHGQQREKKVDRAARKPSTSFVMPRLSGRVVIVKNPLHGRFKMWKPLWHWMKSKDLYPNLGGWQNRLIGLYVPVECIHQRTMKRVKERDVFDH